MATELLVKDTKKMLSLFFWVSFFFWMVLSILFPTITSKRLVARAKQKCPSFVGDFGKPWTLRSLHSKLSRRFVSNHNTKRSHWL